MQYLKFVFPIVVFTIMTISPRAADERALPNPFYAMDTGTDSQNLTAEQQVTMVKELGFDGMDMVYREPGLPKVKEMLAAIDKHGLKLFGVYYTMRIEKGTPTDLTQFTALCEALKGRGETLLMTPLYSKSYAIASPEGKPVVLSVLRKAAAIADKNGLRISIYPHAGAYAERVDFAAQLAKQSGCKNVGVNFNLCHWMRTDGTELEARAQEVMPVLYAVTICGADKDGAKETRWTRLIMTLDQGDYDVAAFVAAFTKLGFKGPIGLQHYGIKGDAKENLTRSMSGWKKISAKAAQLNHE